MKMRRRIAQAQDYADYDAIITAEICDRRNGAEDRVARQRFLRARLPNRVKTRIYRAATATAASPQSADMPLQAPSPIAECAMRQSRRRGRTAPSAHARSDDNYQGNRHNHCDGVDHASLHPLTV